MEKPINADQGFLAETIFMFKDSPLDYVIFAFPWGEKGTSLEEYSGPDKWQREYLLHVEYCLKNGLPVREATTSGHGIGKSTLVSWLILWFLSCNPSVRGRKTSAVVTANTKEQLMGKTWAELAKWHKLAINSDWFKWTATSLQKTGKDKDGQEYSSTWRANAVPWSKENTEGFAGLHGDNVMVIFDEASAVDDQIYEVSSGAMTTKGAMWFLFGNPTRNSGRFYNIFQEENGPWTLTRVDSRESIFVTEEWVQEQLDYAHGDEDSDYIRIRMRGVFPRHGSNQFIPTDRVNQAMERILRKEIYSFMPLVIGCDPARFGEDATTICLRQGRKLFKIEKYMGLDTMYTADRLVEMIQLHDPQLVFIDEIGLGAGIVDRLVQLGYGSKIIGVNVANRPSIPGTYYNKRAEIWGKMGEWLKGADIPQDKFLFTELTGLEYMFSLKDLIQLEKKTDFKARLKRSPDSADALSLTFAEDIYEEEEDDYDRPQETERTGSSTVTGY